MDEMTESRDERIEFIAALPPIQSAVNIGGAEGDSSRVKLDIPGTEIAAVVRLLTMRGRALQVTVEPMEG